MAHARISQAGNRLRMVKMNRMAIVKFGEEYQGHKRFCIATENLNGCHGVAIISRKAAALGHLTPSHPNFPPGEAYADYFTGGMTQLISMKENKPLFEHQGANGLLVVGFEWVKTNGDDVREQALPWQVTAMAEKLKQRLGLHAKVVEHGPIEESDEKDSRPDRGKVFIEGFESGQLLVMWLEENQVNLT